MTPATAMILDQAKTPLRRGTIAPRDPQPDELVIAVSACGVCRTDLHVVDGDLTHPKLPLVPGHEIVGRIVAAGKDADRFPIGTRVGVPWLGWTCGVCDYCRRGLENLCPQARFTGYDIDGGYAGFTIADHRYCFALPDGYADAAAAPLLCAGLIGYRTLMMAGDSERIGIYGFGAAAHIVAQVALHQGRQLFAFTRPGDVEAQRFALQLGCRWVGGSDSQPPEELDAALIFAPVGSLIPAALRAIRPGGTVVSGGIHMSEIPAFPYEILWGERTVRSVANLTRRDAEAFLALAPKAGIRTHITELPLSQANRALDLVREGALTGAAVLIPD